MLFDRTYIEINCKTCNWMYRDLSRQVYIKCKQCMNSHLVAPHQVRSCNPESDYQSIA